MYLGSAAELVFETLQKVFHFIRFNTITTAAAGEPRELTLQAAFHRPFGLSAVQLAEEGVRSAGHHLCPQSGVIQGLSGDTEGLCELGMLQYLLPGGFRL